MLQCLTFIRNNWCMYFGDRWIHLNTKMIHTCYYILHFVILCIFCKIQCIFLQALPLSGSFPQFHFQPNPGANVICMNMYTNFVLWNLCLEFMWQFFLSFQVFKVCFWRVKNQNSPLTRVYKMNHIVKPSCRLAVFIWHDQILLSPRFIIGT